MLLTLVLSILLTVMAHLPTIYAQPPFSVISPKVFIISMVCHRQSSIFISFNFSSSPLIFDSTSILLLVLFPPNHEVLTTSFSPKAKYGTTIFLSPALGISHPGPSPLLAFPCSSHASSALKPALSANSPSVKAKSTLPFP